MIDLIESDPKIAILSTLVFTRKASSKASKIIESKISKKIVIAFLLIE